MDTITITKEHITYLEILRDSGVTNMFGAGVYLQKEFNLNKQQAHSILSQWIESYDK